MKIKITLTALIISICSYSQCKSGDCDNGRGIYEFEGGNYFKGEFKNGDIFKGKLHFKETGNIEEGIYVYDVEITSSAGAVTRILQGKVTVTPQVTR